jgi:hypothetical protein
MNSVAASVDIVTPNVRSWGQHSVKTYRVCLGSGQARFDKPIRKHLVLRRFFMSIRLGMQAKLYHGTAGASATTELTNVKDVTLNLETGEADISVRASQGWRATVATLKNGSVEFSMLWDVRLMYRAA